MFLGWDPSVNVKLIYVSYTPYMYSNFIHLNSNFIQYFNNFLHETKLVYFELSESKCDTISSIHVDHLWLFVIIIVSD